MIKFSCTNCSKGIVAHDNKAGDQFNCPSCQHNQRVPLPYTEPTKSVPAPAKNWYQRIHPDVYQYGKQAIAHFVALLMFAVVAQFYLDFRVKQIQGNVQKELEKTFTPENFGKQIQSEFRRQATKN